MIRHPEARLYFEEIVVDGFAGGGGTSEGIEMALDGRSPDIAINHDDDALAMHRVNHPNTRHMHEEIYDVDPVVACSGRPCGLAWFSPDCTFHSKARGGAPFRDPNRARRVRGLVWIAVRWAKAVRPRVICIENVEELEDWGPLGSDGRPDPKKRGQSFQRWCAQLRNLGYALEYRELRASPYGAPTSRKRLVIVARCDGQPIVWPTPSHGPRLATRYLTAADHIDFSLPVPSIFLTPAEAREWGRAHGVASPKRPLAAATLRRIARGVDRFVLSAADPFIVPVRHQGDDRIYDIREPLRTIAASDREFALVAPVITKYHGSKRDGDERVFDLNSPLATLDTSNRFALVAAFLAKHNGGHEATGQRLMAPADTITTVDQKALVISHLLKMRGGLDDHFLTSQDLREPLPTTTAGGTHYAEVRAFLLKFYGSKKDGRPLHLPLDTVTTKERFGLVVVMVGGEEYAIVDIGMRMLTPRELYLCQGFPARYVIDHGIDKYGFRVQFTKKTQTRLCGNSVPPQLAAAVVRANYQPIISAAKTDEVA